MPVEGKQGLRCQICRSAVSQLSNIAEGCSRTSQLDFKRFLEMALGSAFELETHLIIIEELSIISNEGIKVILDQLNKEQKMINNLIGKLKANS
ncbi:MAG: four helix bundle protein [bacterium]